MVQCLFVELCRKVFERAGINKNAPTCSNSHIFSLTHTTHTIMNLVKAAESLVDIGTDLAKIDEDGAVHAKAEASIKKAVEILSAIDFSEDEVEEAEEPHDELLTEVKDMQQWLAGDETIDYDQLMMMVSQYQSMLQPFVASVEAKHGTFTKRVPALFL
jgi:hypothetical protein